MRIGVLASGTGSNLQALIDASARGELGPARLVVVGVNVPDCPALGRAVTNGIPTFVVDHRALATRAIFDAALIEALGVHRVELVVLAGFMRILTSNFLSAFPCRVINIHPSLLPAFPGTNSQAQAFRHGVKLTGCTVHFVETGVDSGPIIGQACVPIMDDDDEETVRLRILTEEHRLLPAAVRALAEGRVSVEGRLVRVRAPAPRPAERHCR